MMLLFKPAFACGPAGWSFLAPLVLALSIPSALLTCLLALPLLHIQGRRPRWWAVLLSLVTGCAAGFPITYLVYASGGGLETWVPGLSAGCAGVTAAALWLLSSPLGASSSDEPPPLPAAPERDPSREWRLVR